MSVSHKHLTTIPLQRRIQCIERLQTDSSLIRHIVTVLAALFLNLLVAFAVDLGLRLFRQRCASRTCRIQRRGISRG